MELLRDYESDNSESEQPQECVQTESLNVNAVRSVYLVTYSQADLEKFPTRSEFASAVVNSFSTGTAIVLQWCCSREPHQNSGVHYHMCLKLDRNQRWIASKRLLQDEYGISVHFSNVHYNYYSAWSYVTKEDIEYIQSDNHPRLTRGNQPRTNPASRRRHSRQSRSQNRRGSRRTGHCDDQASDSDEDRPARTPRKRKRMSAFEFSEIITKENIKTLIEVQALAAEQKTEGKTDLAEFLVNRTPRAVADILQTTWEIENAQETLERSMRSRIDLLRAAKNSPCVEGCNGEWINCAQEILQRNGVSREFFANTVYELLRKGRGKYRNLMIIGPANCGKTFILNPLTSIYKTFCNPATGSFAWIGVEKAECVFLNDFRWSPQLIPWQDLLLLLEGHVVHFPASKTHFSKDIDFDMDTPIFCTSKNALVFIKNGMIDERETEMMRVRWTVIQLNHQIPRENQRDVPSCPRCFANIVLYD